MGEEAQKAASSVASTLDVYLDSDARVAQYGSYFLRECQDWRSGVDAVAVGMLVAAIEGACANPPGGKPTESSIAAWAYIQVGSAPAQTRREFEQAVRGVSEETSRDRKGTLLAYDSLEELSTGYQMLSEALISADMDALLSRCFENISSLLSAVLARSELDFEHTYEGTAVAENALVEWLLDNTQGVIDYAKVLSAADFVAVSARDDLEDAFQSLKSGYDSFVDDAR